MHGNDTEIVYDDARYYLILDMFDPKKNPDLTDDDHVE
jgi:hypothetical protein